jgi:hypothetical protein
MDGTIDIDTHAFRSILSNTGPNLGTNTVKADITEIGAGNGYAANGVSLASIAWAETGAGSGIWQWSAADWSWTAAGGSMAAFRYVICYDDTPTSPADPLIGQLDYGSSLTLTDGNTFTVDVGANGIFRLS